MTGATTKWVTITDLSELASTLDDQARRCAEAGAFQAACLMAAAHLEAVLITTAGLLEDELRKMPDVWPTRPERNDILNWDLGTAVGVATRAGWFANTPVAGLEEAVEAIAGLRNACAHPAAYVRDVGGPITDDMFVTVYNVIDFAAGAAGEALNAVPDPPFGSA